MATTTRATTSLWHEHVGLSCVTIRVIECSSGLLFRLVHESGTVGGSMIRVEHL